MDKEEDVKEENNDTNRVLCQTIARLKNENKRLVEQVHDSKEHIEHLQQTLNEMCTEGRKPVYYTPAPLYGSNRAKHMLELAQRVLANTPESPVKRPRETIDLVDDDDDEKPQISRKLDFSE